MGGKFGNNLQVCSNGSAREQYLTDSNIKEWTDSDDNIFSDHAPIKYKYVINDKDNEVTCDDVDTSKLTPDSSNLGFITWNIAYRMTYVPENTKYKTPEHLKSKFYCSKTDIKQCVEKDKIYEKRLQNILSIITAAMNDDGLIYNKYVFFLFNEIRM